MLIQPLAVEAPVAVPAMPVLFGTRRAAPPMRLAAVLAGETAAALGLTAAQPIPPGDRAGPSGAHALPLAFNLGGLRSLAGVPPCSTLRRQRC